MEIVINYTEAGIAAGWRRGGKDLFRHIRFLDGARENNAVYNEILAAGGCVEATEFLRDSLGKIVQAACRSIDMATFFFLLPTDLSAEALATFRRVCTNASEGLGEIHFLTCEEAIGGYLAGRGITEKVAVLSCGRQLSLFEYKVGKEDGLHVMTAVRLALAELPFSAHELLLSALGRAARGEDSPVPMNTLTPSFSELEDRILSDGAEETYQFWGDMSNNGLDDFKELVLDFQYEGRACNLFAEHVYASLEPFRTQLRLLGAGLEGKLSSTLFYCGTELPRTLVKSAVTEILYSGDIGITVRPEGEELLLEGALNIASGEISFTFTFPYTLGIKTFVYAEGEKEVVVKPIYLPLISKGESSSGYRKEVAFDGFGFKAGDENANIILYVKDEKDRIREIPVVRVSEVAKTDDYLRIGIRIDGREPVLLITNGETKRSIPLAEMIDASAPSLLKTPPRSINIE